MVARLLFAVIAATASVAGLAASAPAAAADAGAESAFVDRVNDERAGKGLAPLAPDGELVAVARRWSGRMARDNRVAHNPNLAREVSQNWEKLAENVGAGPTVDDVHRAFMASASHRANIVDGSFTHIGVGVVTSEDGRLWVTQVFMRLGAARGSGEAAAAPPTTRAPRATPSPSPTAAPAPRPARRPPAAAPATATSAPSSEAQPAAAPPAPPRVATPRLVLVLETLRALESGA